VRPLFLLLMAIVLFAAGLLQAGEQDAIRTAGDVLLAVLPASAAGLTWYHHDFQGTLQFARAASLTLGVTFGLKYLVNEKRPDGGEHSFPSGHASLSFCAAEFMRKRYGGSVTIPAYAAAAFVGYSRVASKRHYTHDVLAGAALGIGSSYFFTRPWHGWCVQLDGGSRHGMLRLSRAW